MNKPTHPIDDDRLIDFVNRLLPLEMEQDVLAHLRECNLCESRLKVVIRERELARTKPVPTVRDGVVLPQQPRRTPGRRVAAVVSVAAAVVAVSLWWFNARQSTPEAYWMPIELGRTTLRSESPEADANLGQALDSYGRQDARGTIDLLREAPVPQDEMLASVQHLMLASALVNAGDYEAAIEVLEELDLPTLPLPWRHRGLWVHYLALRGAGRTGELRAVLNELASDPGDLGEMARHELGRLEGD